MFDQRLSPPPTLPNLVSSTVYFEALVLWISKNRFELTFSESIYAYIFIFHSVLFIFNQYSRLKCKLPFLAVRLFICFQLCENFHHNLCTSVVWKASLLGRQKGQRC